MIKRKQMPVAGAVLKLVIGVLTIIFILGIFLIVSGCRELERVNKNNSLNPAAIEEDGDNLCVYSFDGTKLVLRKDQIRNIYTSMSDTLAYLNYDEDGKTLKVCLGLVENSEIRKFNEVFNA